VRRFAADVLGQIKSKKAFQPLIDVLVFDNKGSVREKAAKALGKINCGQPPHPKQAVRQLSLVIIEFLLF
jgi:hypothetical protein